MQDWNKESFGMRLKELREQKGMSMMAFGAAIGTSASRVKDWEKGKNAPSAAWIARISDRFNVSTDELILGDVNREAPFTNDDISKVEMLYAKLRENLSVDEEKKDRHTIEKKLYIEIDAHNKDRYKSGKGRRLAEQELFEISTELPKKDLLELLELAKLKRRLQ